MNLTITNTDEVTVYLLFASAAIFLLAVAILIYCCFLMLETQQKLKQLAWLPRVDRDDGEWPHIRRQDRN